MTVSYGCRTSRYSSNMRTPSWGPDRPHHCWALPVNRLDSGPSTIVSTRLYSQNTNKLNRKIIRPRAAYPLCRIASFQQLILGATNRATDDFVGRARRCIRRNAGTEDCPQGALCFLVARLRHGKKVTIDRFLCPMRISQRSGF